MVRLDRSVFSIVVGDVKKPWGFRFPLPLGWVDHLYNGAFGPQNVKKIDLAPPHFVENRRLFGTYIFQQAFCREQMFSDR
jgi:hypothetical protein